MVYYEINKKNYHIGKPNLIDKLNRYLTHKHSKIFILFYMEGCGPCNATRPEWSKLQNVLSKNFLKNDNIVIVSIDQAISNKLKNIGSQPSSFPTIKYITNKGNINENYEDSNILRKDRTIDSFVEWIKNKTGETKITKSEVIHANIYPKRINKTRKRSNHVLKTNKQRGGKWSLKYKRSINCNKPKGFSQKQYCKYGRN